MDDQIDRVGHVGVKVPSGPEGDLVVGGQPVSVRQTRPGSEVRTHKHFWQLGDKVEGSPGRSVLWQREALEVVRGLPRQ